MMRRKLHANVGFLLAALALGAGLGCWKSSPYEPPGRFTLDSISAEIRVLPDTTQQLSALCHVFIQYRCEILGGVIDNVCALLKDGAEACVFRDYVLPCYVPPEPVSVDSVDLRLFEERFNGVDTVEVIVELHGFMPDERLYLDLCTAQDFSFTATLRAPVKRLTVAPPGPATSNQRYSFAH
jgi:hypothetical protein